MKICMLGAGAMGSSIGGWLADSGEEVVFIDTWKEHIDALRAHGLKMRSSEQEKVIPVRAQTNFSGLETMDLVIVFVKSFSTHQAIENAKAVIGPDTMVLSLQNGLGNEEEMGEVIDPAHLIGGRTYTGARMIAPGYVESNVRGKETLIGEFDGAVTERVRRVVDAFNRAGLECGVHENIKGLMWAKLLMNVATVALTAITRLPYGPLYQLPELHECGIAAAKEGIAVAKALGVQLPTEDPEDYWKKANEHLPYLFKPSMLQGVEAGQQSEISYINGAIVRFGEAVQIDTPVNRTLVACMLGVERWITEFYKT